MLFHVLIDNSCNISFSPVPEVDKRYNPAVKILFPALPLSLAKYYLSKLEGQGKEPHSRSELENVIIRLLHKGLIKDGAYISGHFIWQDDLPAGREEDEQQGEEHLSWPGSFSGRQITESELPGLGKVLGVSQAKLIKVMHKAVLQNEAEWLPAVSKDKSGWRCERCGGNDFQEWPSQYGPAATCRECLMLGSQTTLQILLRFKAGPAGKNSRNFSDEFPKDWSAQFSPAENKAAQELFTYVRCNRSKEVLLWAACGAGKAEVSFPLIAAHLAEGKRVLFAVSCQDAFQDVLPRIKRDFPGLTLRTLCRSVSYDYKDALLTLSTAHQALRFYDTYHLIIFDEFDAYPCPESNLLARGMMRALRRDGQLIYLTATPSEELLAKAESGSCPVVRLPVRDHARLLPLPQWVKISSRKFFLFPEENNIGSHIPELEKQIKLLMAKGPILLFLPTVALVREWLDILRKLFAGKRVEGSWGSDPQKREKVKAFREGEVDIFISTLLPERGLTVPNVQVVVLHADHAVFDTRILVQMTGKAGRTAENPSGTVLYLAHKETSAMISARRWIEEQNILAQKEGFISV